MKLFTKRALLILLSVFLLLSSGCSKTEDAESAPTAISATNATIETTILEEVATDSTIAGLLLSDFIGTWAEAGYSEESGGISLDVVISDSPEIYISCISGGANRIATALIPIDKNSIENNQIVGSFDNDGWGNSGDVILTFSENEIVCEVSNVLNSSDFIPMWGIPEGKFSLTKIIHSENASPSVPDIEETNCPPESQIKSDLLYLNGNCFELNRIDTYLDINKVELQFVQTNGLTYTFTYQIEFSNEFYKVVAIYEMSYVKNGVNWIYNSHFLKSHQRYAIKSQIDPTKVTTVCERTFDNYQIVDQSYRIDENGVFIDTITFQGTLISKYCTESYNCTYTYRFDQGLWYENWKIEPPVIDWSAIKGSWTFEHYDEYIKLDIHDITQTDRTHIKITYSYATSPWCDDGPWNGYFKNGDGGESRTETNLVCTREIDLYDADDWVYNHNYSHLDRYAFIIPLEVGSWKSSSGAKGFHLFFDINQGFCIHDFKYLYKDSTYTGTSWNGQSDWYSDAYTTTVYFEKKL